MKKPFEFYNDNIKELKDKLQKIENNLVVFAILRLAVVGICMFLLYYFYKSNSFKDMVISFSISLIVFIVIAFTHNNVINKKNRMILLLEFNERGIKRLNGQWKEFKDIGEEYIDSNHNFSSDLDIFGKNSLFQWINTTKTIFGRNALAKMMLLNDLPNKYNILDTQEAIKELSSKRDFAERIYVEATDNKKEKKNIDDLLIWAKTKEKAGITIKYIPYIFISVTIMIIILLINRQLSISYLVLDLIINYLVVKLLTRRLSNEIDIFIKYKRDIFQFSNILTIIQNENFESCSLKKLQKDLVSGTSNCKSEMNKLKNIISWIGDSKSNAYYFVINVFILSDIFILYNLFKWREANGDKLEKWLNVMGQFEALISLSNLAFEHQEWTYPEITANKIINTVNVGHPLLGDKAKKNDFILSGKEKVALITGSNMSGKSTFLRTIGFNMVLVYLGLPTNSDYFKCGIYKIYTCMRTQDNLEESISSFYAEILRIKLVIEAAKSGENVFFLLDEIFKGTNSVDRHVGAKVLVEQLVNLNGIGLVSTHDLELCDLEKIKPWLINYNFQEYYEDNNIKFDYLLRKGRSTTQNAKHLMKLAGIKVIE
jgi:DNA mismatch repair ATPase MutS